MLITPGVDSIIAVPSVGSSTTTSPSAGNTSSWLSAAGTLSVAAGVSVVVCLEHPAKTKAIAGMINNLAESFII